jgi:hypothetical protein
MSGKRCTGCGQVKPLEAFGVKSSARDGHRSQCKECRAREYQAQERTDADRARAADLARRRYQADPEKPRAARVRYYRKHAEASREAARRDYWENRDQRRASSRRWKAEHHDEMLEHAREADRRRYQENREQMVTENLRRRAKVQNETADRAGNRGKQWTGPELEIACRDDLTLKQAALMLGRTLRGVEAARHACRVDPRKITLAGMPKRAA